MGKRLRVEVGTLQVSVSLDGSATAEAIWRAAPFTAVAARWGQEIYFACPTTGDEREATAETVSRGAVGFWPPGRAFCLFCGPTPLSVGNEIRPASPVAVLGQITDETVLAALDEAPAGTPVRVTPEGDDEG